MRYRFKPKYWVESRWDKRTVVSLQFIQSNGMFRVRDFGGAYSQEFLDLHKMNGKERRKRTTTTDRWRRVGGGQNKQKPLDIEEPDQKLLNSENYCLTGHFRVRVGDIFHLHSCVHRWLSSRPLLLRLLFVDPANRRSEREGTSSREWRGRGPEVPSQLRRTNGPRSMGKAEQDLLSISLRGRWRI